jgi:tRNA dimethylallyltransferase
VSVRILVVIGPTASGKTSLGVEVAHRLGSEIISADSRQTYRGLDIGSGKDLDEYARVEPPVPYHLIDVEDPVEIYSLFRYQQDCYQVLDTKSREQPFSQGVPLLMVGGSGLYIESVLKGYRIANVAEDVGLRQSLMHRSHEDLLEELDRLDPEQALRTDRTSKKRVVRALEIARYGVHHQVHYSDPPPVSIDYKVFGIDVSRDELGRRIDTRLDQRLRQGLIDEVRDLLREGPSVARMNQLGLEYREVTAYLTGTKTERQMIEDLRRGIRKFAKRQRTWFRGLPARGIDVTWIGSADHDIPLKHEFQVRE